MFANHFEGCIAYIAIQKSWSKLFPALDIHVILYIIHVHVYSHSSLTESIVFFYYDTCTCTYMYVEQIILTLFNDKSNALLL